MIFVDTSVIMYAVGREHPLRVEARSFFARALRERSPLATSAEVLQELMHAYLPVRRTGTLDAAFSLVEAAIPTRRPLEAEDVVLARSLSGRHAALGARDLLHFAGCARRGVTEILTFDRALAAAFRGR